MKRIADAADPLYKTLDDGQKRRLAILTHMGSRFGGGGWRHRGFERGMDRDRGGPGDRATAQLRLPEPAFPAESGVTGKNA